ncbi:MAG: hypothetical protein DI556_06415 [Rhodovulum sulfidophilum]|uniref:ABC transporter domain-containing protein n=1 Tax=Rhodovulum sulfidophilum TaxID=35806 RepID=A0A2W5Q0J1_RHOSU|nr:MAG: hypothetical protein DI556_06415 [Rhodovulum sulfidophilum]
MSAGPLVLEGAARIGGAALFPPLRLELRPGEWTTLLGPSGVGKSTVLRLIAGLPSAAVLEGRVTGRRPVALMAQDPGLLPWLDVTGNVTLGARLRGVRPDPARAARIIARAGLAEHAGKRPAALSGGQRQRVALARTLMEDRPLVLLDEPFSALDARLRAEMQELAAELLRGRMVLMVTHDPAEAARLSDRILLLTEKGLTEVAPPDTPAPRRPGEPRVLACQGVLLDLLMARAA